MSLQIVFVVYKNYLYSLHAINIWKSIKNFHFIFHHFKMMRSSTDSAFWTEIDIRMETINLVRKPMKFSGQFGTTAGSPSNSGGQQWGNYFNVADDNSNLQFIHICRWFNNDIECYSDCWYVHICSECKKKKTCQKNYKKKWFIDNFKINILTKTWMYLNWYNLFVIHNKLAILMANFVIFHSFVRFWSFISKSSFWISSCLKQFNHLCLIVCFTISQKHLNVNSISMWCK